jgi:hypothetical protein
MDVLKVCRDSARNWNRKQRKQAIGSGPAQCRYALCNAFRAASAVAKTRTFPSFERKQSSPVLAIQGRDEVPRHAER